MKKKMFLLLCMAMCLFMQNTYAQSSNVLLNEDFENVPYDIGVLSLPEGWTRIATPDYPDDMWRGGFLTFNEDEVLGNNGSRYYMCTFPRDFAHDLWAFTPVLQMEAGKTYNISFYVQLRDDYYDYRMHESIEVKIGTAANAAGMTTLLYSKNDEGFYEWRQVLCQFTATTTGSYYVGFHCNSEAGINASMIDDVKVEEAITTPDFSGNASVSFGNVYTNLSTSSITYTDSRKYEVRNRGVQDLIISGYSSSSPEITVGDLPKTIAPGAVETIDLQLTLAINGAYSGNVVLETNDTTDGGAQTIALTANGVNARRTKYHVEGFEGTSGRPPQGWEDVGYGAGFVQYQNGYGHGRSGSLEVNIRMMNGLDLPVAPEIVTHFVEMGTSPRVKLDFWLGNSNDIYELPTPEQVVIGILVSADFGKTYDTVHWIAPGSPNQWVPDQEWTFVDIDLSDPKFGGKFTDKICRVKLLALCVNGANYWFYADDMKIGTEPTKELAAVKLAGNTLPYQDKENKYTVSILNKGIETQSSYTVKLMCGNTELGSANGVAVAKGETKNVEIPWTPTGISGIQKIYAKVVLAGDELEENDKSPNIIINVLTDNLRAIRFGSSNLASPTVPIKIEDEYNGSQSLYYSSDLGTNTGKISGIGYRTAFPSELSGVPIEIYLGETPRRNLDNGWFDPGTLKKVYDGTVDFVQGDLIKEEVADAFITFDSIYEYKGGNLIVYALKKGGPEAFACYFACTETYPEGRVRYANITDYLYPEDGESQGLLLQVPDITLIQDITGSAELTGVIRDIQTNAPLSGITVSVKGTQLSKVTGADGRYSFVLKAGNYGLEASARGYFTDSIRLDLTAGVAEERDIALKVIEHYTLTGKVTDAVTGNGIANAKVLMLGYQTYGVVADAQGNYTINNVFGGEGFEYRVRVLAEKWYDLYDTVEVSKSETINFALEEVPYSPSNVVARRNSSSTEATVTWEVPNPKISLRYDNGIYAKQLGFGNETVPTGIIGSVFKESMLLYRVSWYIKKIDGASDSSRVNIFLFAIDENGLPTENHSVIGFVNNINSPKDQWYTWEFTTPVAIPNGFMLAMSAQQGRLALGTTIPDKDYPFNNLTHFLCSDFTMNPMFPFESNQQNDEPAPIIEIPMLRAEGTPIETLPEWVLGMPQAAMAQIPSKGYETSEELSAAEVAAQISTQISETLDIPGKISQPTSHNAPASKSLTGKYDVYRLVERTAFTEWQELATDVTELSFTDKEWATVDSGVYQYAVVAKYTNYTSVPKFSNRIGKGIDVKIDDNAQLKDVIVYSSQNKIYIVNENNIRLSSVQVFDMMGRVVRQTKTNSSTVLEMNVTTGYYIVRLVSEDGKVSNTKIYLKK
jgi:hypothetical protein